MTPVHILPGGRPLIGFEKVLLNPAVFELASFYSKLFRLRDRLRCPDCAKVGTWKMHGSQWDRLRGDRHAYRWLCKWCGYYIGPEGARRAWPSKVTGAWQIDDLVGNPDDEPTEVPADYMPESVSRPGKRVNPWAG